MSGEIVEALNEKISIPPTDRESRTIAYDCSLTPAHLCIFMLAASGYTVNSKTVEGVDDWIIASLWRSINMALLLDTRAGKWLGERAMGRTRDAFCHLRRLVYPLDSGASYIVTSPSEEFVTAMRRETILRITSTDPFSALAAGSEHHGLNELSACMNAYSIT